MWWPPVAISECERILVSWYIHPPMVQACHHFSVTQVLTNTPFSIYIHLPYCTHRCPYCDFNVHVAKLIPEERYESALLNELRQQVATNSWKDRKLLSVFFGGGTPSLFSPKSIGNLLKEISKQFQFVETIEVTLEANPKTLDLEQFTQLLEAGVTRLSFGIQSFNNQTLLELGRNHSREDAINASAAAIAAGFKNINFDLIYGAPNQTLEDFKKDLQDAVSQKPQHISCYSLTIEPGTPFHQKNSQGKLNLPDEEISVLMFEQKTEVLQSAGWQHYEISNFALPGYECIHNMNYWNGGDYMGLGAGAHSFLHLESGAKRWSNISYPDKYMSTIEQTSSPSAWSESLDAKSLTFEFFFLGLRKLAGVDLSAFENQFGNQSLNSVLPVISRLVQDGLLTRSEQQISLSQKGLLIADSVIESFASVSENTSTA